MKGAAYAVRPQREFDGKEFSGESLDGLKIVDRIVRDARFERAFMRGAVFDRSKFMDCSFANAFLDRASLARTVFENCDFTGTSLVAVDAREAVFRATRVMSYDRRTVSLTEPIVSFDGATIEQSSFVGARMNNASLVNVNASHVNFREASLQGARFDGCTLAGSDFAGAKLQDADFSRAEDARSVLPEWAQNVVTMVRPLDRDQLNAALQLHARWLASDGKGGRRLSLRGVDLSGAQLDDLDLSGCELRNCRLDSASMADVRLIAADLRGTTFAGADLSRADLREALVDPEALRGARGVGGRR
ncbi:MAG: pentapeptide repeat-containing protein [Alphaproteobacteria bacterium]|nr:pentapeptide repeat-containing protein [Alphaproteobacteria bacterium]